MAQLGNARRIMRKTTIYRLKSKIAEHCKLFITNMKKVTDENLLFYGCNALKNLAYMQITGVNTFNEIENDIANLKSMYGNCTVDGFYNKWCSESWNSGIEYLGRNASIFEYLHQKYVDLNCVKL